MTFEKRSYKDERGQTFLQVKGSSSFTFRYPYFVDARKLLEGYEILMRMQLMEDQEAQIKAELKELYH